MKLAIVTGSSRGLGLAIVQRLLLERFQVLGLSRTAPNNLGAGYSHLLIDLNAIVLMKDLLGKCLERNDLSNLDEIILIHNASVFGPVGLLPSLHDDDIQNSLNLNLVSGAVLSQLLISHSVKMKVPLKILFISSPAAMIGIPGATIYCIAKAGLESLVKGIHSEIPYYQNSVKCVSFMSGRIDTEMQTEMRSYSKDRFPMVERYQGFHEKGELQKPGFVANIFCENLILKDIESGRAYSIADFVG